MATRGAAAREHLERLLRVGTCLAQCGYGAQVGQLAACARAFRGDAQLWTAHARHRGRGGRTALMCAAGLGDMPRIQFLLERGADVEAVEEKNGDTAASENGHCEAARALVERGGANVSAACVSDGMTALMYASQNGHLETVRFLLGRGGANVSAARTTDGYTALMWASQNGFLQIVRCLIEHGNANVNAAHTDGGYTALMLASQNGHLGTVRILIERGGADVNAAKTSDGMTALMRACQYGHLEIACFMVQHGGATVNASMTNDGRTALMWASQEGHLETVRHLLLHGADRHALTFAGVTAHDLAASHPLVRALLLA